MTRHIIHLDQTLCSGMGDCVRLAPDAFTMGPDGIARAIIDETEAEHVIEAAYACPMAAIMVTSAEPKSA